MAFFSIDLNKTPIGRVFSIVFISCSMILAPFWHIYDFHPSLFNQLDLIKLLLLCAAISFPCVLIIGIFYGMISGDFRHSDDFVTAMLELAFFGSLFVLLGFMAPSTVYFISEKKTPLHHEYLLAIFCIAPSLLLGVISRIDNWQSAKPTRDVSDADRNPQAETASHDSSQVGEKNHDGSNLINRQ